MFVEKKQVPVVVTNTLPHTVTQHKAGIEDGDLVIVRKQSQAKQGEIVVAVVDEDATVKRIDYGPGGNAGSSKIIRLVPENENYQPIEVDITQQDFYIAGVVDGLMRRF